MELKVNGLDVQVDPAEQEDAQLVNFARGIAEVARERGLELSLGEAATSGVSETIGGYVEVPTIDNKESLTRQLPAAIKGYKAVQDVLIGDPFYRDTFNRTIEAELETWFTEDKLAYVVAAQEADPRLRYTLVATPNNSVTPFGLIEIAEAFGKNQSCKTHVPLKELYDRYTYEQISRTDPDNGNLAVFSLIPNVPTPGVCGTATEMRAKLLELQAAQPFLKVPSPLESVTYWHTLRARGDRFVGVAGRGFERADILHFDLPEQEINGLLRLPHTMILEGRNGVGEPLLDHTFTRFEDKDASYNYARLAVG